MNVFDPELNSGKIKHIEESASELLRWISIAILKPIDQCWM